MVMVTQGFAVEPQRGGYNFVRSTGSTDHEEIERLLGRELTTEEGAAMWANKSDEVLVDMGR